MAKVQKFDAYDAITSQIIEAIEAGVAPWRQPWAGGSGCSALPLRSTGEPYRGINILALWIAAQRTGFSSPYWMTYRQAQELGGNVRKGEKSTTVVKYGTFERANKETGEDEQIPYLKAYRVFNADQCDGLPDRYAVEDRSQDEYGAASVEELEAFFAATGAKVSHGGSVASYDMIADRVQMPPIEAFISSAHYYSTLAHEVVHWTGHKSRLDRFKKFETKAGYAFEELIAEIGTCFVGAQIGIEPTTEESAAYIEHWLKSLREDNHLIFKAASAAQKAADFVLESAAGQPEQLQRGVA
ncbi:Antirestriction protein ArdC [Epibacterium ulvae]|uniref:Antirestriction protein ArdC n=1 Tax=Epibacterium ulvae TaxID=1156985 RepID=A0A1G5RJM6_9RHOB|nr:zincin-like metallopeptidase domain-containing protein [Epibacterium ulvae]SCZ73459.1 Antirestriction protein ArdC [Epibacterium ulvae]